MPGPYITVTVRVESDIGNKPTILFEKIRRLGVTEAQAMSVQKAGGDTPGVYTAVPGITQIPAINALIIASEDNPILLKLSSIAPADGIISLKGGGMLVLVDCSLATGGANTNALCNNVPANAVTLDLFSGGT